MHMCNLGGCLYNLRDDPLEMVDLADEMPIKADTLRAKAVATRLPLDCRPYVLGRLPPHVLGRLSHYLQLNSGITHQVVAYGATAFNPHRGTTNPAACRKALGPYGGFWGPFLA